MNNSLIKIDESKFIELVKKLDITSMSKLVQLAQKNGISQADIDSGLAFIKRCQGGH